MILTYLKEQFKNKILAGIKIHTIREDKHYRWQPGMIIHHWLHNPRNVSKHPHQFLKNQCTGTQEIWIYPETKKVYISGVMCSDKELELLAINDGFESVKGFLAWFNKKFDGKIIHWTDFRY